MGRMSETPADICGFFPGQQRQVRVLLRHRRQPTVEKIYRVVVSELPVELAPTEKASGLFMLFRATRSQRN